jgi:8-oxo-dGTP diphosphatase
MDMKVIKDSNFGLGEPAIAEWQERLTARAVIFDSDDKVALLYVAKKGYHKLPGGGVEDGEDIETALRREVIEEVGCHIANLRELAKTEEYRGQRGVHQISHCFTAEVRGPKGEPSFMPDEIADGFKVAWLGLAEAIKILESENEVEDYEGKFINARELFFLKQVKQNKDVPNS